MKRFLDKLACFLFGHDLAECWIAGEDSKIVCLQCEESL